MARAVVVVGTKQFRDTISVLYHILRLESKASQHHHEHYRRRQRHHRDRRRHLVRPVAEVPLAEAHVHHLVVPPDVGAPLLSVAGRTGEAVALSGNAVLSVLVLCGWRKKSH